MCQLQLRDAGAPRHFCISVQQQGAAAHHAGACEDISPQRIALLKACRCSQATVYQCLPNGGLQVVQIYTDDDVSCPPVARLPVPHANVLGRVASAAAAGLPFQWHLVLQADEEFFACKWTVDVETSAPLLLLAGKNSVLRVLDVMREKLLWVRRTLQRAHLFRHNRLASASALALAPQSYC